MTRRAALLLTLLFCACPSTPTPVPASDTGAPPGPDACVPRCSGRECGSNGCGGSCGACTDGKSCDEPSGECLCEPKCTGKQCGPNGCGGFCGTCGASKACSAQGACEACTPQCGTKVCGLDPAGCSCGVCTGGANCTSAGQCVIPPGTDAGRPGTDAGQTGLDASRSDAGNGPLDAGHLGYDAGAVDPGTWADYSAFAATLVDTACAMYVQCGLMDAAQTQACKLWFSGLLIDPGTRASLEGGARIFDRAAAARCQAFLSTATCNDLLVSTSQGCTGYLTPAAGLGHRCYGYGDCLDQRSCVGPTCAQTCSDNSGFRKPGETCDDYPNQCDDTLGSCSPSGTAPRVCVAFLADGQPCTSPLPGAQCNPHASFCDYPAGVCRARLGAGAPCEHIYSVRCREGLLCKQTSTGDAGFTGACVPRPGAGEACLNAQCADGLNCFDAICRPSQVNLGDPCTQGQYCTSGYCKIASGSTLGVCALPTIVGVSQPCALNSPKNVICAGGLFCDPAKATCAASFGPGKGPCKGNDQCKFLLACIGAGTCEPQALPGESCATTPCLDLISACDSLTTTCGGPRPVGASCFLNATCQSGNCANAVCAAACPP